MRRLVVTAALAALVLPASASAASRPDLTVSAVKLSGAQVTGTVRNAGRAGAKKTTLEVVISADGRRDARDTRVATVSVKALKARKTATFKATVRAPATLAGGRYTVLACADPSKKVRESKETNNCRAASARLTIAAPAPAPVLPGAPAPFPGPVVTPPAPTPTATAPTAPEITSGPSGTVDSDSATFTFTGTGPFECRLDGGAWAACTSPRTYTNLPGGAHSFEVRSAHGHARRDWTAAFEAPAPGPTDPPATDPAPAAPATTTGESTLMGDSTAFLYTGATAVQTGVAPGTISDERAAVLRGRVLNRMGTGIGGVRVTVLGHPEYGRTASRADGGFDLAVNGGAPLTLSLTRAGWVPAQRTVDPSAQDFEGVDDITLIPYSDTVTGVDLDSATQPEVVRGAAVTDDAGTRRPTLLFEPGTEATAKLADGTTVDLPAELNVRATEFTVGETGPSAMPGELPPTSAYTYAVEYSVDEADELGAVDVRFDKPVATYTDNFLEFPAGTPVPSGYYDRALARWVPADDGVVIEIVGESGGLAAVDLTGDGAADTGLDEAERRRLAEIYDPGKSLWRVEITHFTPWDHNWPFGPPDGALPPWLRALLGLDGDTYCSSGGSIIGCERQTLGEEVGIAGTPYNLRYASDRAPGRRSEMSVDIPLTPANPPAPLKRVEVAVEIAGQQIYKSFGAGANQTYTFVWDGKDGYGRTILGRRTATIRLSYVYDLVYRTPATFGRSFAAFGAAPFARGDRDREFKAWQETTAVIGGLPAPPSAIGGWNLDVHQTYDPVGRALYGGDGTRRSADGANFDSIRSEVGPSRSGARVIEELEAPEGLLRTPDGALLIADTGANAIRKVAPDGAVSVVASGLDDPADLALAPDGSLFVAERGANRIRRIAPGGQITTVAGTGGRGYDGDGGPALQATFDEPSDIAVSTDGTLWVVDAANHALRRIGTDGVIATALGDNVLHSPADVALRPDGSVLVADTGNHRLRQLAPDGTLTTIAGDGTAGFRGDDGPAADARLDRPSAVTVAENGSLLIADTGNAVVRSVSTDGQITTVAGIPRTQGDTGDGGPAARARFEFLQAVVAGDGREFLVLDAGNERIRAIEPPMPALSAGEFEIPSADGNQLYVFGRSGRHLRTLDAMTGATLLTFGYDAAGRLTSVADDKQLKTTIERVAGEPTAIAGPYGHRTVLETNGGGYLSKIEDPAGSRVQMTYKAGGLMTGLTDPNGGEHVYTYDDAGRLLSDRNGERGLQTLTRTQDGDAITVTLRTAEGRETKYRVDPLPGDRSRRTITDPNGGQTVVTERADGTTTVDRPTGERETFAFGPDPRFGMQAPLRTAWKTELPSGKTRTVEAAREVDLANPSDPLSLTRLVERTSVNGRSSSVTYDPATHRVIGRSPSGAESITRIDSVRRPLEFTLPGMTPVTFAYDTHGRITQRKQGAREYTYTYNAQGLNETMTDPLSRVSSFAYDAAGRMVSRTEPGGRTIAMGYDGSGAVTQITPPARPAHALSYTKQGLIKTYTAPGAAAMTLGYDADDNVTSYDRPGAGDATLSYDSGARVQDLVDAARGETVHYDYEGPTTRRKRVTAPGQTVENTYDGPLLLNETFSGDAVGTIARTYDGETRITSSAVGTRVADYAYDADGLPIQAGELITTRSGNGLRLGTQLRSIIGYQTNDGFGEPTAVRFEGPAGFAWAWSVERDDAARVTSETVAGVTTTYGRDEAGRLIRATRGGADVTYTYDLNGNRLSRTEAGQTVTGVSDEQDRLRQWGTTTYDYQDSGELARKVVGGAATTTYEYDSRGNLRKAVLPDGTQMTYTADGLDRRTAVRKDGTVIARYVYGEALGPSAEVGPTGAVLTRFVYGSRSNVPDYMERGNQRFRFVLDSRGSVRAVVNADTGLVEQQITYDEFGRVLSDSKPGFQPFGFAGGLYDRDTGLVNFDARDYDPEVGRFTAKDPIGFDGGETNLYAYAAGDPVTYADPSGRIIPLIVGAIVVGGLVNGAMAGAQAAACGGSMGSVLSAAGQGFVTGAVGTGVGIGVGMATGNPFLGGAAGGLAAEGVDQAFAQDLNVTELGIATATGSVVLSGRIMPLRGRPKPKWFESRGPGKSKEYRQDADRMLGQTAIDTLIGGSTASTGTVLANQALGCSTC